jgi:hypothetical protein
MHPGQRRALGLHFVPEERLGRGAVPTLSLAHNLLLTRNEPYPSVAGGWIGRRKRRRRATSSSASTSRPAARTRRPSRCRAATCRSSSWGARSTPRPQAADRVAAHLGAWTWARRRRFAARSWRCAMRAARCWWSARSWTNCSNQRPPACDRQGAAVALGGDRAEATVERIGEWMSGLWHAMCSAPGWPSRMNEGGEVPCSSLNPPPAFALLELRLAAAGAGHHRAHRRAAVHGAGQGPGARPAGVLLGAHQVGMRWAS